MFEVKRSWRAIIFSFKRKMRKSGTLRKIHFGKIYFGKIHFGIIQLGKIHFGKINVGKNTIRM